MLSNSITGYKIYKLYIKECEHLIPQCIKLNINYII